MTKQRDQPSLLEKRRSRPKKRDKETPGYVCVQPKTPCELDDLEVAQLRVRWREEKNAFCSSPPADSS